MKLATFLQAHQITPAEFARTTGFSKSEVSRWLSDRRHPRPESMKRIYEATGGKVGPDDFFDMSSMPPLPDQDSAA